MNKLDFAAINQALNPETVVPQWVADGFRRGPEWVARNPNRADRSAGSFTINLRTGVWKDFADGSGEAAGSDLVSLYAYLFHGGDQGAAAKELAANVGIRLGDPEVRKQAAERKVVANIDEAKPTPVLPVPADAEPPSFKHFQYGEPTGTWTYRNKDGAVLLYVCRFDPEGMRKQVIPRSWCLDPKDGTHRWAWRGITGAKKRPLYGLDRLAADPERDAIVVEGEKTADAAQRLFGDAAIVTCWLGGGAAAEHVNVNALAGRRVTLWPDFDAQTDKATGAVLPVHQQPGVVAMMKLALALKGVAREVWMVGYTVGEFADGWDLADGERDGWTTEQAASYMVNRTADPQAVVTAKPRACAGCGATLAANEVHYYGHTCEACEGKAMQQLDEGEQPPAAPKQEAPGKTAANEPRAQVALTDSVNPYGWPHMTDKGQPLNTVENLGYMLGEYGVSVRYNVISKDVEVRIPGTTFSMDHQAEAAMAKVGSLCAMNRMPKGDIGPYIILLADANPYNPAAEWIDSKPWDGRDYISELVDTLDPVDRDLSSILVRRWMIGAAGCVYSPDGMSMQGVLVLQGEQNSGKTTWFWSLTNRNKQLAREGVTLNPSDRDSVKGAISYWLNELGELDATFRKADVAALKQFLTKDKDELFLRYSRAASMFPRRTAFMASVNPTHFLHDETGNRRYWTVRHGPGLRGVHDVDVQQAWAQAKHLWQSGEQHRLTRDELDRLNATNEDHREPNTIEELILARFDWQQATRTSLLSSSEVLQLIGFDKPNNQQAKSAGTVLRKLTGEEPRKSHGRMVFALPPMLGDLARLRKMAAANDDPRGEDRPF